MFTESLNEEDVLKFLQNILYVKVINVKTNIGYTDFIDPAHKYTACIYVKIKGHFKPKRLYASFNDKMFTVEKVGNFSTSWQKYMREKFGRQYLDKCFDQQK